MKGNLQLIRYKCDDKQTLGKLFDLDDDSFVIHTLELDWDNNQKRTSCIPPGCYEVEPRYSEKYKDHFHIKDVPNRDFILFHSGNYHTHILGCILPGTGLSDINADGRKDVTSSRAAMDLLLERYPEGFRLEILFGTI